MRSLHRISTKHDFLPWDQWRVALVIYEIKSQASILYRSTVGSRSSSGMDRVNGDSAHTNKSLQQCWVVKRKGRYRFTGYQWKCLDLERNQSPSWSKISKRYSRTTCRRWQDKWQHISKESCTLSGVWIFVWNYSGWKIPWVHVRSHPDLLKKLNVIEDL